MMWIFITAVALIHVPIVLCLDERGGGELLANKTNSSEHYQGDPPSTTDPVPDLPYEDIVSVSFHPEYCSILINNEIFGQSWWTNISEHKNTLTFESGEDAEKTTDLGLRFEFPFYGKEFDGIVVGTDGMVNLCNNCEEIEYPLSNSIYPLKAYYLWNSSVAGNIKAHQTRKKITIRWENMTLFYHTEKGQFSFQLTLLYDGTIIFVYKNIPVDLSTLDYFQIGMRSMRYNNFSKLIKTGHVEPAIKGVEMFDLNPNSKIKNWTTIIYTLDIPCNRSLNCHDCTRINSLHINPQCHWCSETLKCVNRCGLNQRDNKESGCHFTDEVQCAQLDLSSTTPRQTSTEISTAETEARTSSAPELTTLKPHTGTATSKTNEASPPVAKGTMDDQTPTDCPEKTFVLVLDLPEVFMLMAFIVCLGIFYLVWKKWESLIDGAYRLGLYLRRIGSNMEYATFPQFTAQNGDVHE